MPSGIEQKEMKKIRKNQRVQLKGPLSIAGKDVEYGWLTVREVVGRVVVLEGHPARGRRGRRPHRIQTNIDAIKL